jgi:hypothetical protein
VALVAGVALGCNRGKDANAPDEPEDPLRDAARAIPTGKAEVRLTRSRPAGEGAEAEYEWTVLARADGLDGTPNAGARVAKVVLKLGFDDRGEKPPPGRKKARVRMTWEIVHHFPGQSPMAFADLGGRDANSGGNDLLGDVITLHRGWEQDRRLFTADVSPAPNSKATTEVRDAPLDTVARPVFQGPETFDLPAAIKLLELDARVITLRIE